MSIKLNNWQTVLLFLPLIVGLIITEFSNLNTAGPNFLIANLLFVLNIFLVIFYQTQLATRFNYTSGIGSKIFSKNASIAAIFTALYLIYTIYITINKIFAGHIKYLPGPFQKTHISIIGWIIVVFLIHAFITFYFINNQFVRQEIKLMSDKSEREKLTTEFLIPMKKLVRISIWVFIAFFTLTTIADLIKFRGFL